MVRESFARTGLWENRGSGDEVQWLVRERFGSRREKFWEARSGVVWDRLGLEGSERLGAELRLGVVREAVRESRVVQESGVSGPGSGLVRERFAIAPGSGAVRNWFGSGSGMG